MDYNDKKSVCINNLRFPLILGVVLIHNRIIEPSAAFNEGFLFLGLFNTVPLKWTNRSLN